MPPSKARAMACWLRLVDTTRRNGDGRRRLAPGSAGRAAELAAGPESNGSAEPTVNDDGPPTGAEATLLSGYGSGDSSEAAAGPDPAEPAAAAAEPRAKLSLAGG